MSPRIWPRMWFTALKKSARHRERRDFAGVVAYWQRPLAQLAAATRPHAELETAIGSAQRLAAAWLPPAPR